MDLKQCRMVGKRTEWWRLICIRTSMANLKRNHEDFV